MDEIDSGAPVLDKESDPTQDRRLERTDSRAMASMLFELNWQSEQARHSEHLFAPKLNMWRDILPPGLEQALLDRPVDFRTRQAFAAGDLVAPHQQGECLKIRSSAFNRRFRKYNYIEPRNGRFYPRGFIAGTRGIYPEERTPFRVGEVDEQISVDLNHPLAGMPLDVGVEIRDIWAAHAEHGGACNDVAEMITLGGPGMQARWRSLPTDFFSDIAFSRMAPEPDAGFYAMARRVHHLDSTARAEISVLYGRLIPPGSRVLDLMSSWVSHLPDELTTEHVTGLGMNAEELAANPRLAEQLVHDLNLKPQLPFADAGFDAVICTASVEYLIKPLEVFAEVARVLRPGGRFIVTFSDRWFPPKVIKVWQDCHPFERMGLVLEYFLRAGGYENLHTWSQRGLPRPKDDKYADRLTDSDPLFAVWGDKAAG